MGRVLRAGLLRSRLPDEELRRLRRRLRLQELHHGIPRKPLPILNPSPKDCIADLQIHRASPSTSS